MALPDRALRVLRSVRQAIPSGVLLGRRSSGFGPSEFIPLNEVTQAQLDAITSVQGSILYRGATEWEALSPGTAGQFLKTNGASSDPEWANASGSGVLFNPPLAADYPITVNNAGSTISAADDSDRGLLMTLVSTSGTISYGMVLKAYTVPGSGTDTFIWAAKYTPTVSTSGNTCAGLVLADAAATTSDRLFFGFNAAWSSPTDYFIRQATGNTTVAGGPTLSNDMNEQECWFKVEIDSTGDIRFYVSRCGAIWFRVGSTTVATHLGTLSHIGWFCGGILNNTGNMSIFYYAES